MKHLDKSNARIILTVFIACFLGYVYLDYNDIPSNILHIDISHINANYFGVAVNAFLVIVLYVVSYYVIEKSQSKKNNNAKEIATLLLNNTYKDCLRTLEYFINEDEFTTHILPKIKHGTTNAETNEEEIKDKPFRNNDEIMHLAENGYISKRNFQNYINTRNRFNSVVSSNVFWMYIYEFEGLDNTEQKQKCIKETEIIIEMINHYIKDLTDELID